jgi:hypothetical protein
MMIIIVVIVIVVNCRYLHPHPLPLTSASQLLFKKTGCIRNITWFYESVDREDGLFPEPPFLAHFQLLVTSLLFWLSPWDCKLLYYYTAGMASPNLLNTSADVDVITHWTHAKAGHIISNFAATKESWPQWLLLPGHVPASLCLEELCLSRTSQTHHIAADLPPVSGLKSVMISYNMIMAQLRFLGCTPPKYCIPVNFTISLSFFREFPSQPSSALISCWDRTSYLRAGISLNISWMSQFFWHANWMSQHRKSIQMNIFEA